MGSGSREPDRLAVITGIPTPYRQHQFRVLDEALKSQGFGLDVWFLAKSHPWRQWEERDDFPFRARLSRAPTLFPAPTRPLYLSLAPWFDQLRDPRTWLLIGAPWYEPAVLGLSLVKQARSSLLFWLEGAPSRVNRSLRAGLRSLVYRQAAGFVVSGEKAESWEKAQSSDRVIRLPNFVDERLYRDGVDELRKSKMDLRKSLGIDADSLLFFWPARLYSEKGILPFLAAISDVRDRSWTIAIAGEGPLRPQVEAVANQQSRAVRLLGHLGPQSMLKWYAAADVALLPSKKERFGFAAVEALWAGLPIILSDQVGAQPEVVPTKDNGWVISHEDPTSMQGAFQAALKKGVDGLAIMGGHSRALAESSFPSKDCADGFVKRLRDALPPKKEGGER